MNRKDIREMGLAAAQIGATPETITRILEIGGYAVATGVTQQDVRDVRCLKARTLAEASA